jgi:hypothetical protein
MRSWLAMCAVVLLGLALGYGLGFATSAVGTVKEFPWLSPRFVENPYSSADNFTVVFREFSRLAFAEIAATACDVPKKDAYFSTEDHAIHVIQDRVAAAGLNPPLDLARARLALRRAEFAEKNNDLQLKTQYEETVQQLLQKSGWKDPSPAHLRQIVDRIDYHQDTCSASVAKVEPSK